jgi:hypothetical protein
MRSSKSVVALVVLSTLSVWGAACSSDESNGGSNGDPSGDGGPNGGGSNAGSGGAGSGQGGLGGQTLVGVEGGVVVDYCGDAGCACSNGVDDDGDGLADGFDPECTGPLDHDETSFETGIPGDNVDPKWQDCFFDGNSGAGDDGCRYSTQCLTGELEQDDADCSVTKGCLDYCKQLTPNGCDCFGCCTVFKTDGTPLDVTIGSSCSMDKIDDEKACPRCEKSVECGNDCGECELCLGKTVEDLPASCQPVPPEDGGTYPPDSPPPPIYTCDGNQVVCTTNADCPQDTPYYCQLGCCLPVIR